MIRRVAQLDPACVVTRTQFTPYLDGRLRGTEMAAVATHLDGCAACAREFAGHRAVQSMLAELRPAQAPARLQSRLREALRAEKEKGSHLPLPQRWTHTARAAVAPFALQLAGGFGLAVVLAGGLTWLFGAPLAAVEADDARMTHMIAPHYLYSQVPPQPIVTAADTPILVDAKVDAGGRVYDYNVITGPTDAAVMKRVEENLVNSVFKPATVFGVPVNGHAIVTYVGVSVRG